MITKKGSAISHDQRPNADYAVVNGISCRKSNSISWLNGRTSDSDIDIYPYICAYRGCGGRWCVINIMEICSNLNWAQVWYGECNDKSRVFWELMFGRGLSIVVFVFFVLCLTGAC